MTRDRFDVFCAGRTGATHVVQWGGSSVWKVGGKVFAVYSRWGGVEGVVLKPTEMAQEIWRGVEGVRKAPYLGRAGWLQVEAGAVTEGDLEGLIAGSHALAAAKLTRAQRRELGLDP